MAVETLMHNTDPLGSLLGDASDINFDNGGTDLTSDNVEDAIKELINAENIAYDSNNSVKDMIDKKAFSTFVTGTLGTVGTDTILNYPTGYNHTNCSVASMTYKVNNDRYDQIPNSVYSDVIYSLRNSGIYVYIGSSMTPLENKEIKLLLIKP